MLGYSEEDNFQLTQEAQNFYVNHKDMWNKKTAPGTVLNSHIHTEDWSYGDVFPYYEIVKDDNNRARIRRWIEQWLGCDSSFPILMFDNQEFD